MLFLVLGACPSTQSVCIIHIIMDSREMIRRLRRDGWQVVRVKGDHHQFKHPGRPGLVTVPHPKQDLPLGTLRSIFKQAGWSKP
jgi:predicted RNA binding protein YcfA (HicA-like mRNA interferase family)